MLKRQYSFILIVFTSLFILAGCSSSSQYTLTPAASKIQFTDIKPAENCQFITKTQGRRGTFFSGNKSQSELLRDAVNDLRNKAAELKGNTIYNAAEVTTRYISDLAPTDIVMEGEVYYCPAH